MARFNLIGGNIRYILSELKSLEAIKIEVASAVQRLLPTFAQNREDYDIFGDVPSLCFSIKPLEDPEGIYGIQLTTFVFTESTGIPYSNMSVRIRSDQIKTMIDGVLARQSLLDQLSFYKMARASPAAGSLAGNIFEFIAHERLSTRDGATYKIRKLSPKGELLVNISLCSFD